MDYKAISSSDKKVEQFRSCIIKHPIAGSILETIKMHLKSSGEGRLIYVVGPTGVGKTTVLDVLEKSLLEDASAEMEADLGYIPVLRCNAVAYGQGNFRWRDFYFRVLSKANEPLLDYKKGRPNCIVPKEKDGEDRLRYALEQCIENRRVKYLLIDEAQHIGIVSSGRKTSDSLETLKSLANDTGLIIVLTGTYSLLNMVRPSGQLSRRSGIIDFHRYRWNEEEEQEQFTSVIYTMQEKLPLQAECNLISLTDYLYERSLGCIGILKDWLCIALKIALEEGAKAITEKLLKSVELDPESCIRIAKEAREGEEYFASLERRRTDLRLILGLDPEKSARKSEDKEGSQEKNTKGRKGRKGRDVGQRTAKRDPVGKGSSGTQTSA